MPAIQTQGACRACGERFSGQRVRRHLGACPKRPVGKERSFDVRASNGPYWLYLEIPTRATLEDLDGMFRHLWVECCDHLSRFTIEGTRYEFQTDVGIPLSQVLRPGLKFSYEYDFGSTTELQLEVVAERLGAVKKNEVHLLARNDPPPFPCEICSEDTPDLAKLVCAQCQAAICDRCAKKHKCEDDMLLPLVNSPRAGVCGYTGSE